MMEIPECLKQLHLPAIRRYYEEMADQARKQGWDYEHYLQQLLTQECDERLQNRIARNLHDSKIPLSKTFDGFDKKRLPPKITAHLKVLIEGSFLDRCENVVAFGNPASGKTHLLCAIGQELIERGRRVIFVPCSQLVQNLLIAKKELRVGRRGFEKAISLRCCHRR